MKIRRSGIVLTEDLNAMQNAAKFVPCLLDDDQKQNWLTLCKNPED
jgi:hypothetical protein